MKKEKVKRGGKAAGKSRTEKKMDGPITAPRLSRGDLKKKEQNHEVRVVQKSKGVLLVLLSKGNKI